MGKMPMPRGWVRPGPRADVRFGQEVQRAKTEHEKTVLQPEIDDTDKQIDHLVYELYGLTDDEIKIVEEERGG